MLQLLLGLLQHFTVAQTITVERNMFAYYRVPHSLLFMASQQQQPFNKAQDTAMPYYILQCPPKRDEDIPRPENMQTCNVISRWPKTRLQPSNVLSKLHTNVSFELQSKPTQRKRAKKYNQMQNRPYKIVLRPLPVSYSRPKYRRFVRDQKSAATTHAEDEGRSEEEDLATPADLTDSMVSDFENDENVDFYDGSREYDDTRVDVDKTTNNGSVLKYLGVRDALTKLMQQHVKAPITFDSDNMSMHLNADHKNYNKGSRTKGYQNMYHRDESFNDHIFYDELKQNGKYETFDKSRHKSYK